MINELKRFETKLKEALKKRKTNAKEPTLLKTSMKEYLEADLIFKKKREEDLSFYKDELVDTTNHCFEREKEHVAFFYPNIELSDLICSIYYNPGWLGHERRRCKVLRDDRCLSRGGHSQ